MDTYFVIGQNDNGPIFDGPMTKEELLEKLAGDEGEDNTYWGKVEVVDEVPTFHKGNFYYQNDISRITRRITVIKGGTVVPYPKAMIVAWEVA